MSEEQFSNTQEGSTSRLLGLTRPAFTAPIIGVAFCFGLAFALFLQSVPEIAAADPDPDHPSHPMVVIKNPSFFFAMRDVTWTCDLSPAGSDSHVNLTDTEQQPIVIDADSSIVRPCTNMTIQSKEILLVTVRMSFKTLFIPRRAAPRPLLWQVEDDRGRWVTATPGSNFGH